MNKAAFAVVIAMLLAIAPITTTSAQWDGIVQASPHAVSRSIEVSFPQIDFRRELAPHVAGAIDAAIAERVLMLLQDLMPLGNIFGTSEITLDAGEVLSLTMNYSGYHPPMAHPSHIMASLTADLRTGQIYQLFDLFDGDSYIEFISSEVERQIAEQDIFLFEEFVQISPDQGFFLTPESLVVYYQVYEIAPYVFGFPQFEIPFEMLLEIAKEGGPIDRLVNQL